MDPAKSLEVVTTTNEGFRYRCPLNVILDMPLDQSHYSPQFGIGDFMWRLHLQQRHARQSKEPFLSLHLQSCTDVAVVAQFKLVLVSHIDPRLSKAHLFCCSFKKFKSAWGMNQFISISQLLNSENGFVYVDETYGQHFVEIDVIMKIVDQVENEQAIYNVHEKNSTHGRSPSPPPPPARPFGRNEPEPSVSQPRQRVRPQNEALARSAFNKNRMIVAPFKNSSVENAPSAVRASLLYPFEHLEALADMTFNVQGVSMKAHRCVIAARMRPLLPDEVLPLQVGCVVSISVSVDVFSAFLCYVYTEEYPEQGVLSPEALLDLYLLSTACEFYDLSSVCLRFVQPLLSNENILNITLTRYNAGDDVLNALYLRALLDNYDYLIQDPKFEEIPGHLFRRLSLILRDKEPVPQVIIPISKNTLGKQLVWLAESGEYSDMELVVGSRHLVVKAHRYILASRCILFSQAMNSRSPLTLPSFSSADFNFSQRSWHKLIVGIYRNHLESYRDFSAEDVAIVFKMHHVFGMDGRLKTEADEAFNHQNALRLLVYAVKHHVLELHERAIAYVANNFRDLIRSDAQAWELISELPQHAVVALFRAVVENKQ